MSWDESPLAVVSRPAAPERRAVSVAEGLPLVPATVVPLPPLAGAAALSEWSTPFPPAVETGLPDLDELLGGGLNLESNYYLIARSGVGKSGLAIQILLHLCRKRPVVIFSTELSVRQMLARAAAQILRRSWKEILLAPPSMASAIAAALDGLQLRIVQVGPKTDIVGTLNQIADAEGTPPVFGLDYLQHLARRGNPDDRRLANAALSDLLAEWSREHRTVGLIVSSTGRAFYGSDSGRTASDHLGSAKESGDIEFDAGGVMFLETVTDGVAPGAVTTSKLHVAKSRFGVAGTIGLEFDGAMGIFRPDPSGGLTELERDIVDAVRGGAENAKDVSKAVGSRYADVLIAMKVLRARGVLGVRPLRIVAPIREPRVPTDGAQNTIFLPTGTRNESGTEGSQERISVGELGSHSRNRPPGVGLGSDPVGVDGNREGGGDVDAEVIE